jgi:hypothetical protein
MIFIFSCVHFGKSGAKTNYAHQVGQLVTKARERLREVPVVMGETGLPMDIK